MKRFVSISLLLIFIFNVGGYYLVFIGLHHQADQRLTRKIEANEVAADETVELKIPITLPYPIQQQGFERVDGKFEYEGTLYKFVKQKLENDTIYIVCVRDIASKQITNTLKDYVAKANDLPQNSKSSNLFAKFLKDFEATDSHGLQRLGGWSSEINFASLTFILHPAIITLDGPPPKA